MRILNAAQMREADRRTIEDIGIPSLVLMENAGRQVVAAIESRLRRSADRAGRRALRQGQQRRRRLRRRAHAASARRRRVGVRIGPRRRGQGRRAASTSRSSAGSASTSSRSPTSRRGSCTSRRVSECDLIIDAMFGTGLNAPLDRPARDGRRRRQRARACRSSPIDLPSGLSADTPNRSANAIEAAMTVTLGAPEAAAGPAAGRDERRRRSSIADIGIPGDVHRRARRAAHRAADARAMRALIQPRAAGLAQGRLRPRPGRRRLARQDRRRGACRASARCARAPASSPSPRPRSCQPIVAAHGAEYMTEPLDETPTARSTVGAVERVLALDADVIASGRGSAAAQASRLRAGSSSNARRCRSCSTPMRSTPSPTIRRLLAGAKARDVIITPHPGEMARLVGMHRRRRAGRPARHRPRFRGDASASTWS